MGCLLVKATPLARSPGSEVNGAIALALYTAVGLPNTTSEESPGYFKMMIMIHEVGIMILW